jgi:hypothetical protein
MVEIFLVQFLVAALGAASTALADRYYRHARIGWQMHSFWVSASIAVICLPVSAWICFVFFGFGLLGQAVAAMLLGTVFFWVYRNLRRQPPLPQLELYPPASRPSGGAIPPAPKAHY